MTQKVKSVTRNANGYTVITYWDGSQQTLYETKDLNYVIGEVETLRDEFDDLREDIPQDYTDLISDVNELKNDFGNVTEATRNLNTSNMGRCGNAVDGRVYPRDNKYYGMESFISVTAGDKYAISYNDITSNNTIYMTFLFVNDAGTVINRTGYALANPRIVTVPTGATKFNLHFSASSEVFITDDTYVQIEKGESQTEYIQPVSAIDAILRENVLQTPVKYMSAIGGIINTAISYLYKSYNNEVASLTHESGRGLFFDNIYNDSDKFAINCSEFAQALYKGITWDNSRYEVDKNSISPWGYTTDGTEQTEQDGTPYGLSYYDCINNPTAHTVSDIVSKDYMIASEMFRYALNHGWGYEITSTRKQVRPGDFVFYVDQNDIPEKAGKFRGITHVAMVLDVGYDNDRMTILESNNYYLPSMDDPVGIGIGTVKVTDYKYGARFPVNDAESEYMLIDTNTLNITESITDWKTTPISTSSVVKGLGDFYTVRIDCVVDEPYDMRIGVRYSNADSIKWYVPMINGTTASLVFYANDSFQYVYVGMYNTQTYTLRKSAIYKGYKPN